MMGGVKTFMYAIMAAITFSVLLVMGNTMAMTVRERTKEVGTLKAIGFNDARSRSCSGRSFDCTACVGADRNWRSQLIYHSVPVGTYIPFFSQFALQPGRLYSQPLHFL
jgi:hypothetical protein